MCAGWRTAVCKNQDIQVSLILFNKSDTADSLHLELFVSFIY